MNKKEQIITTELLKEFDEMYAATEDQGVLGRRLTKLNFLVEELRKIRRQVESGVVVKIEGTQTILTNWSEFYEWAHSRYHILEDGADKWIGDDN